MEGEHDEGRQIAGRNAGEKQLWQNNDGRLMEGKNEETNIGREIGKGRQMGGKGERDGETRSESSWRRRMMA